MTVVWEDLARLLAAAGAGALIGLERELADKPAGFRTNILICLGAALFTIVSERMASSGGLPVDRTRIAAQIVTGVGFLGAGAILQLRGSVLGLTTAATIWAVASVGMAFGAGDFVLGLTGTALTAGVLFGLGAAEARIAEWRTVATFELELDPAAPPGEPAAERVERLLRESGVRRKSWSLSRSRDFVIVRLVAVGPPRRLDNLEQALWKDAAIRGLKRL